MNRNLEPLGLVLLAALAIGALVAPGASAESFIFRSDATSTTLTGEQEGEGTVLTTTAGTVKCEKVTYSGSMTGTEVSEVEVTPTYTGCSAFGLTGTEIAMNGCKYRFKAGTIEGSSNEGSMDIVCPSEKQIVVTAKVFGTAKCTVDVPAQTGLKSVTFTNTNEAANRVKADVKLSGVKYTQTAGTGFGACTAGTDENGTHESTDVVSGESGTEAMSIAADRVGTWMTISPNQLNFSTFAAGKTTTFTLTNDHLIKRYIKSMNIVDINENVEENHFRVKEDNCEGVLNATESCTVTIEFKSGTKGVTRWFRLTYGGFWFFSATHKKKADVFS